MQTEQYLGMHDITFGGRSMWSNRTKSAVIQCRLKLIYTSIEQNGEVCEYALLDANFSKHEWDVNTDGLIYTDKTFVDSVRKVLADLGAPDDIEVFGSEQGMQGDTYVNFDVVDHTDGESIAALGELAKQLFETDIED